ncbi:MAG: hypothetical protein ACJAZN_002090 [Planctomycetota bacterium]|jgi:hypothetical protein
MLRFSVSCASGSRGFGVAASRLACAVVALGAVSCAAPWLGHADAPRAVVRGPIPTRIMQPAGLIFPIPRPRRAAVLEHGKFALRTDVTYSSIFESRGRLDSAARFDGEIARASARLAYGLGGGGEISIEPSALFGSSGFLDQVLNDFHEFTGFAGGGREQTGNGQYAMRLERDGVTAWEFEEDQILLGDLPVSWTQVLRAEDGHGPAVSVRTTIELPTGDEDRGSGSGGIDVGAGVLLERSLGRWTFTGGMDGMQADQPRRFRDAGIDVRTLLLASGGVEYRWSNRTSLLFQAVLQMPLTRDLPFEEIDREILDLGFGISRDLSKGTRLILSFHEDAVAASGMDASLYAGLVFSW